MHKVLRVLKLAKTRWLAMNTVTNRINYDWDPYTKYFDSLPEEDKNAMVGGPLCQVCIEPHRSQLFCDGLQ
jgi:hypothetical protein